MLHLFNVRVGLALVALLGLTVLGYADDTKGTIRSVNADKNEIVLKGILSDTTYELGENGRVCLDGRKAKLADLREGDHVALHYEKSGKRMIASEARALRNATETSGAVRAVEAQNSRLILKGILKDTTYQVEKNATVWINGKEGQLADLRDGDNVTVTYEQRGDQLVASEVRFVRP